MTFGVPPPRPPPPPPPPRPAPPPNSAIDAGRSAGLRAVSGSSTSTSATSATAAPDRLATAAGARIGTCGTRHRRRHRTNARRATRSQIDARHRAVLRRRIDDVKVGRIHRGLEAIAAGEMEPVLSCEADPATRRARAGPAVVVLQAGVHVVRMAHVRRHPVRQRRRHRAHVLPCLALVPCDHEAGVVAAQDVVRRSSDRSRSRAGPRPC